MEESKIERNTLLSIFWAIGCEEHAAETDDEENAKNAGESARALVREYLGEMDQSTWCKLKHYGLSYVNTIEQIGKKMRKGEDYSHLAKHRNAMSVKINDIVQNILNS